ncbi:MAG: sensor domain-containing diguanylate cyclase, partial [Pseudomonadota bacterium]
LAKGTGYELELERVRADGGSKWVIARGEPIRDVNGDIVGLRGTAEDITQRKLIEEYFRHQARYDALTGVPNRVLFHDRLNQGINLARRDHRELALLSLDLDKFKSVNDSVGHLAGDELLKITASRIRQTLRESDTVARVGGDEFTVILPRIASREDAAEVATKIIDAVSVPCELRDSTQNPHQVAIGASIGIAIFPTDADEADRLVEAADAAMYSAKRTGKSFCFCGPRQAKAPAG